MSMTLSDVLRSAKLLVNRVKPKKYQGVQLFAAPLSKANIRNAATPRPGT